jgi:quercetin dioxygenase-like cupin family protein
MNRNIRVASAAGALAVAASVGLAIAEDKKDVVHVDSATAAYKPMNPGASGVTVWGDPDAGAHGVFVKLEPGADVGLHTHTNDVRIVVLKGAYIYKPENGAELRVSAGHYLFVPGGVRHNTGSDAKEGALFYHHGDAKFDLNLVK